MKVLVNGEAVALDSGAMVVDAVVRSGHGPKARGVAVALNGEVVPRGEWPSRPLKDQDSVEVLAAIGGG